MNPVPTRKIVSQACDACRRRKIKCNGLQPCPGCLAAALDCTFNIPQKRGGHYGARARVLNELRGIKPKEQSQPQQDQQLQQQQQQPLPPLRSPSQSSTKSSDVCSPHSAYAIGNGGLESIAIDVCIDAYLKQIYPVVPFLTLDILQAERNSPESLLSRQFISAFCAYVVSFGNVLNNSLLASYASDQSLAKELLEAALRFQVPDRLTAYSPQAVFISFFLYGAYAGLGNYRQAWFYLRETTTLFFLHGRPTGTNWYSPSIYGRLFWILVVSERWVSLSSPS